VFSFHSSRVRWAEQLPRPALVDLAKDLLREKDDEE